MTRQSRLLLRLIVAAYVILGLATSLVVPLGESPDEIDHFAYARYVVENGRLPIMSPIAADNATMEANQPPLYYLLGALLTAGIDAPATAEWPQNACFTFDPTDDNRAHFYLHTPDEAFPYRGPALAFHLVRLLSVLIGATTVTLAFFLGREVAGSETTGLVAAGVLGFNPQFVFITASVNNDVLTTCLGAAILLAAIALAQRPTTGRVVLAGLLIGLGLLTKFALLAFWPLALLAALSPLLRHTPHATRRRQHPWRNFISLTVIPLLVAGWWYARNWRLYGDPLAWAVHLQAKGTQVLRTTPLAPADLLAFARIHFQSYWGWFGWLKIQLPGWAYWLLLGLATVSFVGLLWRLGRLLRAWWVEREGQSHTTGATPALLLSLMAVLAVYGALIRYIFTINWSGYQGRLAYAAAAPVAALLAAGWQFAVERALGGKRLWLSSLFPLLGLALTGGSLIWLIAPAYSRPQLYQPPVAASRACLRLGDALLLEAYDAPQRTRPGGTIPVTLYGYGRGEAAGVPLRIELVGREGAVVAAGQLTLAWSTGEVFSHTVTLPVAAAAQPARAVLRAGRRDEEGGWQAAATAAGTAVATPPGLTTLKLAPAATFTRAPENRSNVIFGEQLALIGYDVTDDGLTLYWRALAEMTADYTTFVHVLDEAGQLVTQNDGQPAGGAYPTSIWDIGEFVADEKEINWTVIRPGQRIVVGLYDQPGGERLPTTTGNDTVTLLRWPPR
jgi:4-amino-4-deoxy-L-arabinose transferase-like glycosyltransferase